MGNHIWLRKVVACFTAAALSVSFVSCYSIRRVAAGKGVENENVYKVQTNSGEKIALDRQDPPRIQHRAIELVKKRRQESEITIEKKEITGMKRGKDGAIYLIQTASAGTFYVVRVVADEADGMRVIISRQTSERVTLPLSEVRSIWVRRISWPLTLLAAASVVGAVVLFVLNFKFDLNLPIDF